jgi:hypothetical protein
MRTRWPQAAQGLEIRGALVRQDFFLITARRGKQAGHTLTSQFPYSPTA